MSQVQFWPRKWNKAKSNMSYKALCGQDQGSVTRRGHVFQQVHLFFIMTIWTTVNRPLHTTETGPYITVSNRNRPITYEKNRPLYMTETGPYVWQKHALIYGRNRPIHLSLTYDINRPLRMTETGPYLTVYNRNRPITWKNRPVHMTETGPYIWQKQVLTHDRKRPLYTTDTDSHTWHK